MVTSKTSVYPSFLMEKHQAFPGMKYWVQKYDSYYGRFTFVCYIKCTALTEINNFDLQKMARFDVGECYSNL